MSLHTIIRHTNTTTILPSSHTLIIPIRPHYHYTLTIIIVITTRHTHYTQYTIIAAHNTTIHNNTTHTHTIMSVITRHY